MTVRTRTAGIMRSTRAFFHGSALREVTGLRRWAMYLLLCVWDFLLVTGVIVIIGITVVVIFSLGR